jgi:hypothetical protein
MGLVSWGHRFLEAVEVYLTIGLVHDSYRRWERDRRFLLWVKISHGFLEAAEVDLTIGLCWSLGWSGVRLDEEEPDFIVVDLLIVEYLLDELIASRLLILQASLCRISVRTNPDDQVVVNEVPIGGHVGPSIGSVVAGCLTTAWNVVAEFLRLWGNSKPIIIVCRAFYSWARCSRSLSCTTLLIVEPGAQDRCHTSLWMTMFRTGTACPSKTSHHRSTMLWVHKDESQCFPPFLVRLYRCRVVRYLK